MGSLAKKKTLLQQHTFFCVTKTWYFPVTRFMEEMLCLFLFTCSSLPPIFTLVAATISHFLTAAIKFSCFSSNKLKKNWKLVSKFFYSFFHLAFPRLCGNLNLVLRKTRLCCCCCFFFSFKVRVAMRFTAKNTLCRSLSVAHHLSSVSCTLYLLCSRLLI